MALEGVHMRGPELAELRKPGIYFLERLWPDPVQAPLGLNLRLHEPGVAEHPEVL